MSETDFGQISPPKWVLGGPYLLCALHALTAVSAWADEHSYDGKVSYWFEAGHELEGAANQAIVELSSRPVGVAGLRYGSHTFSAKADVRPLQAADLLAYEWCKELNRLNVAGHSRPMRRSLSSLLDQSHYTTHFGAEDLDRFLKRDRVFMLERLVSSITYDRLFRMTNLTLAEFGGVALGPMVSLGLVARRHYSGSTLLVA